MANPQENPDLEVFSLTAPWPILGHLLFNASDALERFRYEANLESIEDLRITIKPSKEDNTLTITDNGIGMIKDHLIHYLRGGESGTKTFMEALPATADISLMQDIYHGWGFRSILPASDKVIVISKYDNHDQHKWECANVNQFTIETDNSQPLERGTKIIIHLKEYNQQLLEEKRLKEEVQKYTRSIKYKILLYTCANAAWVDMGVEQEVHDEGPSIMDVELSSGPRNVTSSDTGHNSANEASDLPSE